MSERHGRELMLWFMMIYRRNEPLRTPDFGLVAEVNELGAFRKPSRQFLPLAPLQQCPIWKFYAHASMYAYGHEAFARQIETHHGVGATFRRFPVALLKQSTMDSLYTRAALKLLQLPLFLALLIFLPAGTLDYWEAWLFSAVFFACALAITVYLAISDPALLERRMNAGPGAEKEATQKRIMVVALLSFAAIPILSATDHRFGWSNVPASVVILGDVLVVLANIGFYFVMRENTYSAATIQIAEGQSVISTGPYAVVRHPMYSFALVMMLGIPLALGSWWGLFLLVPAVGGIIWRLLDEEKFLSRNLDGYTDYMHKVRYRLVPLVW